MLYPVAQLGKHLRRNIRGVLCAKIDPDPLGTNQLDRLFNFFQKNLGNVTKQQVCLVKEKDHLGFIQITFFRQRFKQLRNKPKQEGRIHLWLRNQRSGVQNMQHSLSTIHRFCQKIMDVQRRFAKKSVRPLRFQGRHLSDDHPDGLRRIGSVLLTERLFFFDHIVQKRLQVFGVC